MESDAQIGHPDRPDSDAIRSYGRDFAAAPRDAKRRIGVVHQTTNPDRDLTARENLTLHAILHGIGPADRADRIRETLLFAGLEAHADHPVRTFSGGMGRRIEP